MARAIDGEAAYRFLSEQLVKETGAFSKGVNKGLNVARSAMRNPDAIPTLTPPNEWVSVEERLPEESDGIVLLTNGKIVISGYRNQLFGLDGEQRVFAPSIKRGGGYMQVTYWMLLPAPPDRRPPEG